jgi:hypothetical protein
MAFVRYWVERDFVVYVVLNGDVDRWRGIWREGASPASAVEPGPSKIRATSTAGL